MVPVLLSWFLLGSIQHAETVTIQYNSSSNFIPLGSYVTFNCTNFENPFLHSFRVTLFNQTPLLTLTDNTVNSLQESDIFTERGSDTLTVRVSMANNMTTVQCNDGGTDPAQLSDAVQIFAIGPPLAPHVEFIIVSFTELRLEWEEPFTWPGYDIIAYRITEISGSDMSRNTTTNHTTYFYFSPDGEVQQSCQNVIFMVSAYSATGQGEAFVNSDYGLPIELTEIEAVETVVLFSGDCDPEVDITIQFPPVCNYQSAEYTLELSSGDNDLLPVVTQTYSGNLPPQLFHYRDLDCDRNYTLKAFVSTFTQNVTKLILFDTEKPSEALTTEMQDEMPTFVSTFTQNVTKLILFDTEKPSEALTTEMQDEMPSSNFRSTGKLLLMTGSVLAAIFML